MYASTPNIIADAHALPFNTNVFDTVILMEVAEHLKSPIKALHEAIRVLKTDGNILVTVPFMYPIHDSPYDFQRWTIHGIENLALENNLSIKIITSYGEPIETGALQFCLGLSFQTLDLMKKRHPLALVLLILSIVLIPICNITGWILSLLPMVSENPMSTSYTILLTKNV
jgi:SAM-dependent methyltransferase